MLRRDSWKDSFAAVQKFVSRVFRRGKGMDTFESDYCVSIFVYEFHESCETVQTTVDHTEYTSYCRIISS
jgi:hypothetical protein